jgi:hypothetical protein
MANAIKWSTANTISTIFSTDLNSFAGGVKVLSTTIANSVTTETFASFELVCQFLVSPTQFMAIYIIPSLNGTNFADGDVTTPPQSNLHKINIPVRSTTSVQRLIVDNISLPPFDFKVLLDNQAGTLVSSGNTLKMRIYHYEVT